MMIITIIIPNHIRFLITHSLGALHMSLKQLLPNLSNEKSLPKIQDNGPQI